MFGEGVHPRIEEIYEKKLAPFLSQTSHNFWSKRLWYFQHGLYYQGGMGKLCWVLQVRAGACACINHVMRDAEDILHRSQYALPGKNASTFGLYREASLDGRVRDDEWLGGHAKAMPAVP